MRSARFQEKHLTFDGSSWGPTLGQTQRGRDGLCMDNACDQFRVSQEGPTYSTSVVVHAGALSVGNPGAQSKLQESRTLTLVLTNVCKCRGASSAHTTLQHDHYQRCIQDGPYPPIVCRSCLQSMQSIFVRVRMLHAMTRPSCCHFLASRRSLPSFRTDVLARVLPGPSWPLLRCWLP